MRGRRWGKGSDDDVGDRFTSLALRGAANGNRDG